MSNCKGCGGCCSTLLPCSNNEIKTIRHYIKRHKIKPLQAKGLDCPFCDMSKKDKCMIYPVRPWICQLFFCDRDRPKTVPKNIHRELVNMQELFGRDGNDKRGVYTQHER